MVRRNALFSTRSVFAVFSICWVYHGQKLITDYYLAISTERTAGTQPIQEETEEPSDVKDSNHSIPFGVHGLISTVKVNEEIDFNKAED